MEKNPLALLQQGRMEEWISWKKENPKAEIAGVVLHKADLRGWPLTEVRLPGADLREADLRGAYLDGADLTEANLSSANLDSAHLTNATLTGASLNGSFLRKTDFTGAHLERVRFPKAWFYETVFRDAWLQGANLSDVNLQRVDFTGAKLFDANLNKANFLEAKLCGAFLDRAHLEKARFFDVDFDGARIQDAYVYGVAVWGSRNADKAKQCNLMVTPSNEIDLRVDDLETAQFVYLIVSNEKIRQVIDVMTMKAVLILGRFTPDCMEVLESVKQELRKDQYIPILFDFTPSSGRGLHETIQILAGLACFAIADLTSAKSVIGELGLIVRAFPSLPVQPIIHAGSVAYSMLEDLRKDHPWLRPEFSYRDRDHLLQNLREQVIEPAMAWKAWSAERKAEQEELAAARAEISKLKRQVAELKTEG